MVRSRAMRARESGQVRKEAALSGSEQATRIGLTGASHDGNAREPPSKAGPHGPCPDSAVDAAGFGVDRCELTGVDGPGRDAAVVAAAAVPAAAVSAIAAAVAMPPPPSLCRRRSPRRRRRSRRRPVAVGLGRSPSQRLRALDRVHRLRRLRTAGVRVAVREVEVMAAAVAGVAVVADPADRASEAGSGCGSAHLARRSMSFQSPPAAKFGTMSSASPSGCSPLTECTGSGEKPSVMKMLYLRRRNLMSLRRRRSIFSPGKPGMSDELAAARGLADLSRDLDGLSSSPARCPVRSATKASAATPMEAFPFTRRHRSRIPSAEIELDGVQDLVQQAGNVLDAAYGFSP